MVTKCTVEGTICERANALWKVRKKTQLASESLTSDGGQEGIGTVLATLLILTKQTLYAVTDPPPSTIERDPPNYYLYYYTILYLYIYIYIYI